MLQQTASPEFVGFICKPELEGKSDVSLLIHAIPSLPWLGALILAGLSHSNTPAYAASDWEQRGGDIEGAAADDESGYAVALNNDGTIVAVGSICFSGPSPRISIRLRDLDSVGCRPQWRSSRGLLWHLGGSE